MAPTMKSMTTRGKFLALSVALLLVPAATAALAGTGLLSEHASNADAFDRIVPGMTRADDLAGLGFDIRVASIADYEAMSHLKTRAADACMAANGFCTGYVFGNVTLLVMDGRVIDKAMAHA